MDTKHNDEQEKIKETLKLEKQAKVKKPKGSGQTTYTRMKTLKTQLASSLPPQRDARATVAKVKKINKPYARERYKYLLSLNKELK